MTAPMTTSTASQWPPSITVTIGFAALEGLVGADGGEHEAEPDEERR